MVDLSFKNWTTFLAFAFAATVACGQHASTIIMRNQTTVDRPLVTVGDVAQVKGSSKVAKRLAGLDLDELEASQQRVTISRKQIELRAMLAGIKPMEIRFEGADTCTVIRDSGDGLREEIESIVRSQLSEQFVVPIEDLQVQILEKSLLKELQQQPGDGKAEFSPILPTRMPIGDQKIRMEYSGTDGYRKTAEMKFRITHIRKVVVATEAIRRGELIDSDNVQEISRPIRDEKLMPATWKNCIGKVAKVDIPATQLIQIQSLLNQPRKVVPLVRPNDRVDVVVQKGPISIRLKNAKVLSRGAAGESVQVQNPNSGKRFAAVVKDKSTVILR